MPVAKTLEELALLKAVVAKPANFELKFEYACFLSESGDPRGDLLHSVIEHKDSLVHFPSLDGFSQSWLDVTGISITKRVLATGVAAHLGKILQLARPTLNLFPNDANFEDPPEPPAQLGMTRLGGDPDLSRDYPLKDDGRPFVFIGQFNLKNLRGSIVEDHFPAAGLMSLFRTPTEYSVSCIPEPEDMPKLVQFTDDLASLRRVPRPPVSLNEDDYPDDDRDGFDCGGHPPSVHLPYRTKLSIKETLSLPQSPSRWLKIENDKLDELEQLRDPFRLLGYCEHNNMGGDPMLANPQFMQLLRLPTSEGPDYGMTDGSFSIFIPNEDLQAGRFDRVQANYG